MIDLADRRRRAIRTATLRRPAARRKRVLRAVDQHIGDRHASVGEFARHIGTTIRMVVPHELTPRPVELVMRERARQAEFRGDRIERRRSARWSFWARSQRLAAQRSNRALDPNARSGRIPGSRRTRSEGRGSRTDSPRGLVDPSEPPLRIVGAHDLVQHLAEGRVVPPPHGFRSGKVAFQHFDLAFGLAGDVDQDPIPSARFCFIELGVGAPDQVLRGLAGLQSARRRTKP